MKTAKVMILFLVLFSFPVAAIGQRGFGVKIKGDSGQEREMPLYKGSYALIIGESKYNNGWDPLTDVPNDVEAVKNALKTQFVVETSYDLTGSEIKNRISKFIDDYGYQAENRLLIYFAGHGYTLRSATGERERGYIVPIDAPDPKKDELGFKRKAIDDDTLRNYAKQIESKHALFVFDSCFSGMLVSRSPVIVPDIIRESVAFPVREFITSGAANQQVPGISDFRRAFVRGIDGEADTNKDGFILASELANYLREIITGLRKGQTPQHGKIMDLDLNRGEFVFLTKSKVPALQFDKIRSIAKNLLKYDEVYNSWEGMTLVRQDQKYGFVDKTGTEVIPVKFDFAAPFSEGLAVVGVEDKSAQPIDDTGSLRRFGFIDKTGKYVFPPEFDDANAFSEGVAKVAKNGKVFFINRTGKTAFPSKYDFTGCECEDDEDDFWFNMSRAFPSFREGLASIKKNGKEGFVDKQGREVVPAKYDSVGFFSEGMAVAVRDEKYGYVDKTGKEPITFKYSGARTFYEGLAAAKLGEKWGYIDKAGAEVIPFKYDYAESFSDGVAKVTLDDREFFIDKSGKIVLDTGYYYISPFLKNLAEARPSKISKLGFIDKTGASLTDFSYDAPWCYAFVDIGFIGVEKGGKKGFVDLNGNEFFDF